MPAAAFPAVASLGGGIISAAGQNRASRRAAHAQNVANMRAEGLERERLTEDRRRYDEQMEMERQRRAQRQMRIDAVLARMGRGRPPMGSGGAY